MGERPDGGVIILRLSPPKARDFTATRRGSDTLTGCTEVTLLGPRHEGGGSCGGGGAEGAGDGRGDENCKIPSSSDPSQPTDALANP